MYDLQQTLNEIFDSLPSPSSEGTGDLRDHDPIASEDATTSTDNLENKSSNPKLLRTAPLRLLPELIDAFEKRRGPRFVLLEPLEKEQLRQFSLSAPDQRVGSDDLFNFFQAMGVGSTPIKGRSREASHMDSLLDGVSSSTSDEEEEIDPTDQSKMLTAGPQVILSDGSPKRSHDASDLSSNILSLIPTRTKRANMLQKDTLAPLERPEHDISNEGCYLGIPVDDLPCESFDDVIDLTDKLHLAVKRAGSGIDGIVHVFDWQNFAQIRAITEAHDQKFKTTVLEQMHKNKELQGSLEFTLRGLILGPLQWDVELLRNSLDAIVTNEQILMELLIARPPEELSLLKEAYVQTSKFKHPSVSPAKSKSVDASLMFVFAGQAKLRKAWEVAIQGKWADVQKRIQVESDVERLSVALSSSNNDVAVEIILARSPSHLAQVARQYEIANNVPLPTSIKEAFSGSLEKLLLYAVSTASIDQVGIERDVALLWKAMHEKTGKQKSLCYRLVRLHWQAERFRLVEKVFSDQYKKSLVDSVREVTQGGLQDLLVSVIRSSYCNAETESVGAEMADGRTKTPELLEADGQAIESASPVISRSSSEGLNESTREDGESALLGTPSMSASLSAPVLSRSSSSMDRLDDIRENGVASNDQPPTPLSYRQRSSPLDMFVRTSAEVVPRSKSSTDFTVGNLRISRPTAPGRRRTSAGGPIERAETVSSAGSEPSSVEMRSPTTPSPNGFDSHGRPKSLLLASSPTWSPDQWKEMVDKEEATFSPSVNGLIGPRSPIMSADGNTSLSPSGSLDLTSYTSVPFSPTNKTGPAAIVGDIPSWESRIESTDMERGVSSTSTNSSYRSREASRFQGESMGLNRAFGSTHFDELSSETSAWDLESLAVGGRSSDDEFQVLLRKAHELSRRLKEAEARLESTASANEQEISELENRLEEIRSELQAKRREEKELRGAEKHYLAQISALETEIVSLNKAGERSRESFDSMKRNYQEQCVEAESLRKYVAELRMDTQASKETIEFQALQVHDLEQERERIQSTVHTLEEGLALAQSSQIAMDEQKQENLVLKEIIERLRFDMEEVAHLSKNHTRGSSNADAITPSNMTKGTLSRNLGNELARKLADQPESQDQSNSKSRTHTSTGSEGEEDTDEMIVTTTQRKIKRKTSPDQANDSSHSLDRSLPAAEIKDLGVQTDSPPIYVALPPSTRDVDAQTEEIDVQSDFKINANSSNILPLSIGGARSEVNEAVAKGLGVDLQRLEEFVRLEKEIQTLAAADVQIASTSMTRPESQSSSVGGTEPKTQSELDDSVHDKERRASRTRRAPRIGAASSLYHAPSYFINVFPEVAKPFISHILDNTASFVLYSLTIYLTGFITGSAFANSRSHLLLTPFHVMVSVGDQAQWSHMNHFGASWADSIAARGGTFGSVGGGLRDHVVYWINEMVWSGVQVARRVPI